MSFSPINTSKMDFWSLTPDSTSAMDTPYIAALLLTLAVILLSLQTRRRKLNLPPGPNPWPIIGNLSLIGPLPHRSIHTLSQKYGPIMQLRFGSFPVIIASSVEMAKAFLQTHDAVFASRPETAAGKYTTYNSSDILWSSYGPYLHQARKICIMELMSPKRLESFEYIRREEKNHFLKGLYDSSGTAIFLKEHLSTLSLNVISRMVLGKTYIKEGGNEIVTPKEFRDMLDEIFLLNGVVEYGDWIPWIRFLDLQGYIKRMKAINKKFDRFLEHVLDEHNMRRKDVKDYVAKDMVDVLLQLADDPTLKVKLERTGVKAITQGIVAAATDSSATTVEWAISELLKNPKLFSKATEELDRVIGKDRWVEEQNLDNLPYIYAIMKETMRLHPVAPMLVPHLAREDCRVEGYDISKGSRVLVNIWTIGRDPSVWVSPEEFCPERFIGTNVDIVGKSFELLPFGAGRRMCPGLPLGRKIIQSTLANVLHGFSFQLSGGMRNEDLNMEETFGLSMPKKLPLKVVIEPRLAPHLYSF